MTTVRLPAWEGAAFNATLWLRNQLNIPSYQTLEEEFCNYFNCEIDTEYFENDTFLKVYVILEEKDAVEFLLKWT